MSMKNNQEDEFILYLTSRRISSVRSCIEHFNISLETITPVIRKLEREKRVRLAVSQCSSDCGNCHSCNTQTEEIPLIESTSVISLEQRGDDL